MERKKGRQSGKDKKKDPQESQPVKSNGRFGYLYGNGTNPPETREQRNVRLMMAQREEVSKPRNPSSTYPLKEVRKTLERRNRR